MERAGQIYDPPWGCILDRYLMGGYVKILLLILSCLAGFYLIVDFFDHIDAVVQSGSSVWLSFQYFFYKLPLMISQVLGFAVLIATLFSLGLLSRNKELTALRASGLSLRRISLPLMLFSLLICVFAFLLNESLVPIFSRKSQAIYRTQIKKKQSQSLVGTKDIWMRGQDSFIRVDYFDAKKNLLEGVTLYLLNPDFSPKGLIEASSARWNRKRWEVQGATEWLFLSDGQMTQQKVDTALPLIETPEDFKLLARDTEEYSFTELRKQIADLKAKGIDARAYEVDLQIKLAIPVLAPLLTLLAIPFALKYNASGGWALSFGFAMALGFAYWVVLAFSMSLGHSGALPPWIAAWIPDIILTMVALFFSTAEE